MKILQVLLLIAILSANATLFCIEAQGTKKIELARYTNVFSDSCSQDPDKPRDK